MTIHTTLGRGAAIAARTVFSWRGVSFVAGLVLLSGTLAILFHDVVALGAAFTLKHYQTLVIVAGTLLVGILAEQCIHKRKWGSSVGFWALFLAGTVLVIYSSVGRQGEKAIISGDEHKKAIGEELDLKQQIEAERIKVTDKREKADKACEKRLPEHPRCAGPRATQSVYEASLKGLEARLKLLTPPRPVDPEAETFAETAAAFGADKAKVMAIASPAFRYFVTLFFEFGTIWCFARAFGPERLPAPSQLSGVSDAQLSALRARFEQPDSPAVFTGSSKNSDRPRDGGLRTVRRPDSPVPGGVWSKDTTLQHVLTELALGRTVPSQEALRERSGRPKQTISDWVREWERTRLIPARTQAGRCKALRSPERLPARA
ncbi:MAG: hypothetical protein ACK4TP_10200 [Hyphomicrobium sp.]